MSSGQDKLNIRLFLQYIHDLRDTAKSKGIFIVILNLVLIPLEGAAIIMLIPLLNVTGIISESEPSGITIAIEKVLAFLGISKSLETVLTIFLALVIIEASVKYLNSVLSGNVVNIFAKSLKDRLFVALTNSSWSYLSCIKHAKITQVITNEVMHVKNSTSIFFQAISLVIVIAVHLFMAFYASLLITFVTLITAGIILLLVAPINKLVKKSSIYRLDQREQLFSIVKNHLEGIKISKSFGTEEHHVNSFKKHSGEMENEFYKFVKLHSLNTFAMSIGAGIIICLLIYFSTIFLQASPTILALLVFIFFRTVPKITILQRNVLFIIDMLPSYKAIIDLQAECVENAEKISNVKGNKIELKDFIEFKDVSFSYKKSDEKFLLEKLNFKIKVNEITALTGASGAGKSTIVDLIMGLNLPNDGNIFIDKIRIGESNIKSWRSEIGYVSQEPYLLNDTIRNNILLGKLEASDEEIIEALKLSSAYEFFEKLPAGINTIISEKGQRLSGGERQRIALARALIRKPSVLILDEATNAIDIENENKIFEAIENLRHKMTIIIISHRESTVKRADRILRLENGVVQN